jgi:hypothetical protein
MVSAVTGLPVGAGARAASTLLPGALEINDVSGMVVERILFINTLGLVQLFAAKFEESGSGVKKGDLMAAPLGTPSAKS